MEGKEINFQSDWIKFLVEKTVLSFQAQRQALLCSLATSPICLFPIIQYYVMLFNIRRNAKMSKSTFPQIIILPSTDISKSNLTAQWQQFQSIHDKASCLLCGQMEYRRTSTYFNMNLSLVMSLMIITVIFQHTLMFLSVFSKHS